MKLFGDLWNVGQRCIIMVYRPIRMHPRFDRAIHQFLHFSKGQKHMSFEGGIGGFKSVIGAGNECILSKYICLN